MLTIRFLVDCVDDAEICDRSNCCVTRDVWAQVGRAIDQVLDGVTLADMVAQRQSITGLRGPCLPKDQAPSQ